ncbi:MAG TPA: sigma-70 family RNA polymerase sigma factor [Solirubrobacteraceae bacterium]|jgi:RNA polymerase sigma-70 factor (ECF subfamily)
MSIPAQLTHHLATALNVLLASLAVLGGRARLGADEAELVRRLKRGDEEAFMVLVEHHQATMKRLARTFVRSPELAEEVVQDTWLGALRGIEQFAGRSSLRTWLLTILVNRARSSGVREQRSVAIGDAGPAVDAGRFDAGGAWMSPPRHWVEESEERLLAESLAPRIWAAVEELPDRQREVLVLRDVDGLTSDEVCTVLDISEGNQRVLLHRGRSGLRSALEAELGGV